MSALGRGVGAVLAVALVAALGALSRAPIAGEHAGSAALRLTWRVRAEEAGECRHPSPEELAELPAHMRNPDACVGSLPPYRLTVEMDGERRIDSTVEPAGARGDRPIYIYRELLVEPGPHRLRVRFAQVGTAPGESEEPSTLAYDGEVTLEAGRVLLLTRSESGALEVRPPTR